MASWLVYCTPDRAVRVSFPSCVLFLSKALHSHSDSSSPRGINRYRATARVTSQNAMGVGVGGTFNGLTPKSKGLKIPLVTSWNGNPRSVQTVRTILVRVKTLLYFCIIMFYSKQKKQQQQMELSSTTPYKCLKSVLL